MALRTMAVKQERALDAEAILEELNLARTAPASYAAHLEPQLKAFEGNTLKLPGKVPLVTQEGRPAVEEACAFLKAQAPLPPLERLSPGLCAAAADHVADVGKTGTLGHTGNDGSSPFDRMSRHGKWSGSAAENIAYASSTAREACMGLIVDDGVPTRGHRKNIFNGAFTLLGAASGTHKQYHSMVVQCFAEKYTEGDNAGQDGADASAAAAAAAAAAASAAGAKASGGGGPGSGGSKSVRTVVTVENGKRKTTTTTTITDPQGNTSTQVETKIESA